MNTITLRSIFAGALVSTLAGCGGSDDSPPPPPPAATAGPRRRSIRSRNREALHLLRGHLAFNEMAAASVFFGT